MDDSRRFAAKQRPLPSLQGSKATPQPAVKFWPEPVVAAVLSALTWMAASFGVSTSYAQNPVIPKDPQWKKVRAAMEKGLPKTAIDELVLLIDQAIQEKNYDQSVRGIATKVLLESNIQGNQPAVKVVKLQSEIAAAPDEIKPLLKAILAHWYWHYFQQNRWRFAQRTAIDPAGDLDTAGDSNTAADGDAAAENQDFTTWSLPRILAAIDQQFQSALSSADLLKSTASSDYSEFLQSGTSGDAYRPTLFDVIAADAIDFYAAGEQAGSVPSNAFVLSADSPIFAAPDDFKQWNLDANAASSSTSKAILLYQQLLRFHQDDSDATARLDWDLCRLRFAFNQATGEDKNQRYQAALVRFIDRHGDHPVSARASHRLAQQHFENDQPDKAFQVATDSRSKFPDSVGGRRCHNLIEAINRISVTIDTERIWSDPLPSIEVTYRNISKIYFRLIRLDYEPNLNLGNTNPFALNPKRAERLLGNKPARAWSVDLQPTDDYRTRTLATAIPDDIPLGGYLLVAGTQKDFSDESDYVSITEVWRTNLALITRRYENARQVDGLVLDANSGAPIAGASVQVWQQNPRGGTFRRVETLTTQTDGRFQIAASKSRTLRFLVTHAGDQIGPARQIYQASPKSAKHNVKPYNYGRTVFFTDRSIYRPGQTIQCKGICYWAGAETSDYRTLPGQEVTVVFSDANSQEIERRTVRTNDYGSFVASFTAPADRLLGQMSIRVETGPPGRTVVRVEEYKRPKFRVELQSPSQPAKLGQRVSFTGKAVAYTGAPIDGGKVAYRVVRQVQYAPWWYQRCWWMPVARPPTQEIISGVTTTDVQGNFSIEFDTTPDPAVSKASEPTFTFQITADVTDTTGETRSDQHSLQLRYSAILAELASDDFLTTDRPVPLRVKVSGLFGDQSTASGVVKVHRLVQPESVARPDLVDHRWRPAWSATANRDDQPDAVDPANPNSWELGQLVSELDFRTTPGGLANFSIDLDAGIYRCVLSAEDSTGNRAKAFTQIQVLDPDAKQLNIKVPFILAFPDEPPQPGQTFRAIWGSGYRSARVLVEVLHRGKVLQRYWTESGTTQGRIEVAIDESMRGGLSLRTTMVRENRVYQRNHIIDVPWTNKQLDIQWERFVSKLRPGAAETWTAIIRDKGSDSRAAIAEMVATLYDASLDAFLPHGFPSFARLFGRTGNDLMTTFENSPRRLRTVRHQRRTDYRDETLTYWRFPSLVTRQAWGYGAVQFRANSFSAGADDFSVQPLAAAGPTGQPELDAADESAPMTMADQSAGGFGGGGGPAVKRQPALDLDRISARKNLNETAFFYPQLTSTDDGVVRISFTMPEALTEWRFLGLAHDKQLRSGLIDAVAVTAKDLMVQPNPPRFLRHGDQIEFTVKVTNRSPTIQSGSVRLTFSDAVSLRVVDPRLENTNTDQTFSLPAGQSQTLSWPIKVPDGIDTLIYKAVGSTGKVSDGEEGFLPVLSRRVPVTESLPLPIRGKRTKEFRFQKLLDSAGSDSIKHQSLTVQMVSNPSWYAVMALPYLMEYPHQCSEQTFNRLYANALARRIVRSDPKIARIFDQWRGTPALDSPLEKNEDLKSVLIAQSPWQRRAKSESQSRRDVGILFDQNRLDSQIRSALTKLAQMQQSDGSWPWFDGGPSNSFLTLYITTGFGRLRHLGAAVDESVTTKAIAYLDAWSNNRYREIKPENQSQNHLTSAVSLYLYGRSFFKDDIPVDDQHREAFAFWIAQAKQHWLDLPIRQSQAQLAIALHRLGHTQAAGGIMESIKQRSVSDPELGMFWRDQEYAWWWYRASIETQAMMIEAFDEVAGDQASVQACKTWLLKQKQMQAWPTTKSTADAVYALLLRGSDLLASDAQVQVALAGQTIRPTDTEAGTGFYQQRVVGDAIKPAMGDVRVTKIDPCPAWGSVHWQYMEDLSRVTAHNDTPLQLTKQLYVKRNSKNGPRLSRVDGPIQVGDSLVVRLVLRTDRDMEFVHLRDHRGSGTEPVDVLSRYRYQDGLAYYQSTGDTASHFFIDYLPKGTYVFEYTTRAQLRGQYETGFANIQCMYAPEFNAHSESLSITCR